MPRNRNLLGLLDVIKLGYTATVPAVDLNGVDTGAGGMTFVVYTNIATYTPTSAITIQESDDNSTWTTARAVDCSWKFSDIEQDPGEYEGMSVAALASVYGSSARTGNAQQNVIQAQYNGTRRYVRLRIIGLTDANVRSVYALVRYDYRTDAESLANA